MTTLGYQIPSFTYPGVGPDQLFSNVARQAKEAESAGFDTLMVMDHFYQLPMIGSPDAYMLECYALLSALARETSSIRLSSLVTGNTYRNPAVLAKTVTTLDIVSEGRAQLGIGEQDGSSSNTLLSVLSSAHSPTGSRNSMKRFKSSCRC